MSPLDSVVSVASRTSHPLEGMRESFSSFSGEKESLGRGDEGLGSSWRPGRSPLEFLNQLKQIMLSVFHQAQTSDWPRPVP